MKTTANDSVWLAQIERRIKEFGAQYGTRYRNKQRERAASFEIGCLHMLLSNYEEIASLEPKNLNDDGEFQYLTSPNGNPSNFSWVSGEMDGETFEVRQQVRVKSHWSDDIAFCPDLLVLKADTEIEAAKPSDYANGKRPFYCVKSSQVISAHECKSLSPFPELLVSFIGMFQAAHSWFDSRIPQNHVAKDGPHLAPCLFVGGDSRPIQRRMIGALEALFPVNIVTGLHWSRFKLDRTSQRAKYLKFGPPRTAIRKIGRLITFDD